MPKKFKLKNFIIPPFSKPAADLSHNVLRPAHNGIHILLNRSRQDENDRGPNVVQNWVRHGEAQKADLMVELVVLQLFKLHVVGVNERFHILPDHPLFL